MHDYQQGALIAFAVITRSKLMTSKETAIARTATTIAGDVWNLCMSICLLMTRDEGFLGNLAAHPSERC
jgi:hypothetical protein